MLIKYLYNINNYKYLVMFDLASKITGVCLWDIINNKPIETKVLTVTGKHELPADELYHLIDDYFDSLYKRGFLLKDILVGKEAMPTQVHGGSSTVQTFIALARSHAILDLYTYEHNIAVYDYVGVYPISTHSYLKHLMQWENNHPVEKIDIKNYVCETYGLSNDITFDEADATFLAKTLLDVKWNKDLDEEIKAVKKHQKSLKASHAIIAYEEEKKRLEGLKMA